MRTISNIVTFVILTSLFYSCMNNNNAINYPITKKVDTVDVYFGTSVADSYRWLENDTSSETMQWVDEQNKVTFDYLGKIPFRNNVKERLTQLWNYPKMSVPFLMGGYYVFEKNDGLQNQDVVFVQKGIEGEPKIILDPNTLSKDGTKAVSTYAISRDGKYFAYSISSAGSDWVEIFVKEIETGNDLSDYLKWIKFSSIEWYNDGFFYSKYDEPQKGTELSAANEAIKIFYHKIGTPQNADKLIYQDIQHPDVKLFSAMGLDKNYLFVIEYTGFFGNALSVCDLSTGDYKFRRIVDKDTYQYNLVDCIDGIVYAITNEGAEQNKLVCLNLKDKKDAIWKDIIPEKDYLLDNLSIAGGKLIAQYLKDAHSKIEVYTLSGNYLNDIELPALGTVAGFAGRNDENIAFFMFSSFTYPSVIYKYDVSGNSSEVYRKPKIEVNSDDYVTEQVFYLSNDSVKIPMFIVYKKGLKKDGKNPTLLYGYGGFNVSLTPYFSILRYYWLESGGVFALANLRGGGEYGRKWHEDGTGLKKQNVFNDFISAAEYLIDKKYTSSKKLAIQGGSNGGLLIGAVVNQRPDLFKVAIPQVGVMDMLRYHKFTVGAAWASDYGSSEDSVNFENLYKYSPIHNIKPGIDYPAILVMTSDHDDRVVPAHSFKYAATLQENVKNINPHLIRIQKSAGHGAGTPTSIAIDEYSDMFAFIFYNLGVEPGK